MISNRTATPAKPPMSFGSVEDCFGENDVAMLAVEVPLVTVELKVKVDVDTSVGDMVEVAESNCDDDKPNTDDGESVSVVDADGKEEINEDSGATVGSEAAVLDVESDVIENELEAGLWCNCQVRVGSSLWKPSNSRLWQTYRLKWSRLGMCWYSSGQASRSQTL